MEISLNGGLYALNPRRIIYIESYKEPTPTAAALGGSNPYDTSAYRINPKSGMDKKFCEYQTVIVIHMTDNKELKFTTDNETFYGELKAKLSSIVGG